MTQREAARRRFFEALLLLLPESGRWTWSERQEWLYLCTYLIDWFYVRYWCLKVPACGTHCVRVWPPDHMSGFYPAVPSGADVPTVRVLNATRWH